MESNNRRFEYVSWLTCWKIANQFEEKAKHICKFVESLLGPEQSYWCCFAEVMMQEKIIQFKKNGHDRLRTSDAAVPFVWLFQNKVMFLLKIYAVMLI